MKIALTGLPGSGKTSLFNALADRPVDLLPGVPGMAPHVTTIKVVDERLEWLRDLYNPKKYTPTSLTVEDHAGIPPGSARSDRRGELFSQLRNAEGLVLVLNGFADGADPAHDAELVALEFSSADLEICERRVGKLDAEWKNLKERDRVERERAVVQRFVDVLSEGKGAHEIELRPDEEHFVRGFQLLTRKPTILLVNTSEDAKEGAEGPELEGGALDVRHRFECCLSIESELAALDGEELEMFAAEYGVTEPLQLRFTMACYRGLGLHSFFTVGEDEVRAWPIEVGDNAVTAAGKIHTDLSRGFIRAEVIPYEALRELGSEREVKAKGKQHIEGKDYIVNDGDVLTIRHSS
ncbi:MAG: DUF933 domain-containing protein [Planctomycetota bacterium]|jgi:GTP-binding protein YchF